MLQASLLQSLLQAHMIGPKSQCFYCHCLLLQVLELLLERKAAETRHVRELAARDTELARLQLYIEQELAELQERQAQVTNRWCSVRVSHI